MKKLVFVLAIAALAAGCNNASQQSNNNNNNQNQNQQTPSDLQTYNNSMYGFQFDYPKDFTFTNPTYANLQDKVTQVQITKDAYPNTNFGDAAFSVSTQYAKDLASCLKLSAPEGSDGFKTAQTINGKTFYMTPSNGAGAGNLYESKVYRNFNGVNLCTEIQETIHTSNIGNYPAGTVTEVNKNAIWQRLDQITNSFKFNTQNS